MRDEQNPDLKNTNHIRHESRRWLLHNKIIQYTYDSWGKMLQISGSRKDGVGYRIRLGTGGYYNDVEKGLLYVGSRCYDPATGRFINADNSEILFDGRFLQ